MILRDAVSLAFLTLRSAKMRTLLTILGLAVGVGAVLTVLTLGTAGQIRVEEEIAHLGVDKVWIRPESDRHRLSDTDSRVIQAATGAPACAGAYTAAKAYHGSTASIVQVAGFDEEMEAVHAPKIMAGRIFIPSELMQGSPVCLIDDVLDESMGGDLLGKWLTIGNRRLRIVGVMEAMSAQMTAAGGLVILPLRTYLDTFGGNITEITVAVQTGQRTEIVARQALESLSFPMGFRMDTLEEEIGAAREIVRIFVMVLICVAMVCMVTGGIGVMNVLLISVRERQSEIGLIKAIGGTKTQLGLLFLLEAVLYAAMGDLAGIALGAMMVRIFGKLIGLDAKLDAVRVLPVLAAAILLGVCMGVAPAVKAAKLQPVEALRSE